MGCFCCTSYAGRIGVITFKSASPKIFLLLSYVLFKGFIVFLLLAHTSLDADITAFQDLVNDRVNLSLHDFIKLIHNRFEQKDEDEVGVPVKTVCERYFKRTAVSFIIAKSNDNIKKQKLFSLM